jgi:hypothetical protein
MERFRFLKRLTEADVFVGTFDAEYGIWVQQDQYEHKTFIPEGDFELLRKALMNAKVLIMKDKAPRDKCASKEDWESYVRLLPREGDRPEIKFGPTPIPPSMPKPLASIEEMEMKYRAHIECLTKADVFVDLCNGGYGIWIKHNDDECETFIPERDFKRLSKALLEAESVIMTDKDRRGVPTDWE